MPAQYLLRLTKREAQALPANPDLTYEVVVLESSLPRTFDIAQRPICWISAATLTGDSVWCRLVLVQQIREAQSGSGSRSIVLRGSPEDSTYFARSPLDSSVELPALPVPHMRRRLSLLTPEVSADLEERSASEPIRIVEPAVGAILRAVARRTGCHLPVLPSARGVAAALKMALARDEVWRVSRYPAGTDAYGSFAVVLLRDFYGLAEGDAIESVTAGKTRPAGSRWPGVDVAFRGFEGSDYASREYAAGLADAERNEESARRTTAAEAEHQRILRALVEHYSERGGSCVLTSSVDLAVFRGNTPDVLIEIKSSHEANAFAQVSAGAVQVIHYAMALEGAGFLFGRVAVATGSTLSAASREASARLLGRMGTEILFVSAGGEVSSGVPSDAM